jgi:hypothetical protein
LVNTPPQTSPTVETRSRGPRLLGKLPDQLQLLDEVQVRVKAVIDEAFGHHYREDLLYELLVLLLDDLVLVYLDCRYLLVLVLVYVDQNLVENARLLDVFLDYVDLLLVVQVPLRVSDRRRHSVVGARV